MATSLSSQLRKLATPQTDILDTNQRRVSLLFDPSEAENYGKDVYYDIGMSGFNELLNIDDEFSVFKKTLFAKTNIELQRAVQDKATNAKLDQEIEKFLLLVSPYLEKQAAIKALEWLIYRYMISKMNRDALLMCFFPYYESPLFVRALQIIDMQKETDKWHWLSKFKKSGRMMSKKVIFNRWEHNKDFRSFLGSYLKKMIKVHKKESNLRIAVSLFISTIVGALCVAPKIKEDHFVDIVKSMPLCLRSKHKQLVAGMYLIISQLAVTTTQSKNSLDQIISLLVERAPPKTLQNEWTLCLLTVCQHQQIGIFQPEAVAKLDDMEFYQNGIIQKEAKVHSVSPFLSTYVKSFINWIVVDTEMTSEVKGKKFAKLVSFIQGLSLSVSDATRVIRSFLDIWRENFKALITIEADLKMGKALGCMEINHPDGYSQAISGFANASGSSQLREYKEIINAILSAGKYDENTGVKFIHIVHPDTSIRLAAAENFVSRVNKGLDTDVRLIKLNVKYLLADDCPAIVEKGLSIKLIPDSFDKIILLEECKHILEKCESNGIEWDKVKHLCVEMLSDKLYEHYEFYEIREVFLVLLPFILFPKTPTDIKIVKSILNSKVVNRIGLFKAIAQEMRTRPFFNAAHYHAGLWPILPKIIRDQSAKNTFLWDVVEWQLKTDDDVFRHFVCLVLLYLSLADNKTDKKMQLKMANLVLNFSLISMDEEPEEYTSKLSLNPDMSLEEFQSVADEVVKGYIPIQFVTVCVLRALQRFTLPDKYKNSVHWMPDLKTESEGDMILLLKAVKAAHELERFGKFGVAMRNKIMAVVLKDCLVTCQHQFYFLAMIWGWHASLPIKDIVDKALIVWCLKLGSSLISIQSDNISWMLNHKEPLIPALLCPATSGKTHMRKGAVMMMEKLATIKGGRLTFGNHSVLLENILLHKEEIIADEWQLPLCFQQLYENQNSQTKEVFLSLKATLADESVPIHIKMGILLALFNIYDVKILQAVLPLAKKIIAEINKMFNLDEKWGHLDYLQRQKMRNKPKESDEGSKLDTASSFTLYYILLKFCPSTSSVLENDLGWSTFVEAITCSNTVMNINDDMKSPQCIVIDQVMNRKFFASIKQDECRAGLWSHLISCVIQSKNPHAAARLKKGLRETSLDASLIVKKIKDLNLTTPVHSMREAKLNKKTKKGIADPAERKKWSILGLMLETIGVMASLERPWMLTSILCECLHKTFNLDADITELIQQQILSALLHLLQKSKDELGEESSKNVKLNVELIVQCIRVSANPDTHRRAMLILALAADIFPEVVLHNMMCIFTFMGTSLFRRDDSYSFQVIHQTISSIVPMLIKSNLGAADLTHNLSKVCQVFVDAYQDFPEHRRLPLFIQLSETIGVEEHLWIILALMADCYVMKSTSLETATPREEEGRNVPRIIEFALTVSSEFTLLDQVRACYKIIDYVSKLPEDIEPLLLKQKQAKKMKKDVDVINWETHSLKQYMNFKYSSIGLLARLLSSEKFVAKVVEGSDGMEDDLQEVYQRLLEKTMSYIKSVEDSCERNKDKPGGKAWTLLQRKVIDVMEGIVSVLPASMLLNVVDGLLQSKIPLVRCRATELLCSKLQPNSTYFSQEDLLDLLPFIDILRNVVVSDNEPIENRQVGIYALQLLIKHLAPHVKIGAIEPIMATAVKLVCDQGSQVKIVTQGLLVIAEAVAFLKAHAVNHMGQLMPVIINLLLNSDTDSEHLLLATATATHKIVDNLAKFVSPHLEKLVCAICQLCAKKKEAFTQESRLGLRLGAMRDSLPQSIEPRLMIPKFTEAYKILSEKELSMLEPLMMMVENLITNSENKVVIEHKEAFIELFTQALDLRTVKGELEGLQGVEGNVCSAFAKLLLRLNEHDNIAIFVKLQFWATGAMDSKPTRLITFYRFADHLVEKLKVLFIQAKLADNLYSQAASVLERNNFSNDQEFIFGVDKEAKRQTTILLEYVLDTLMKVFLHDSVRFTNQERFQLMVQPLLNQLENTKIGKKAFKQLIANHFIPCVVKFTAAVADDSLWKDLNRAVLLRLRFDDEPLVVLAALQTFEALVDAFGEDYLQPLLPDIMPYITEVFDTLDPEIEAAIKEVYNKMESILGDSFRVYLDR